MWFAEWNGNKIGRITMSGAVPEYAVPTPSAFPSDITVGSDGNLWFTEVGANNIGLLLVR